MPSIKDSMRRAEVQRLSYRASAVSAMGGEGSGGVGPYGMASSGNQEWFEEQSSAARLYNFASRGHAYTAIRPIAVRIADQAVRVGVAKPNGSNLMKRMIEKSYCGDDWQRSEDSRNWSLMKILAPEFVKQQARNVDPIDDHPLLAALADPNPYMTGWALFYCTAYSLEGVGEAIWVMDNVAQGDGTNRFIVYYVPRSWVQPIKTDDGNPFGAYKWVMPNVASENLPPIPGRNVCHFMKPNPANPMVAHSGTQAQALSVLTDDEIQKAQFHLTRNLSRPGMLVVMGDLEKNPVTGEARKPELTVEQRAAVCAQVRQHYTTAARFGDPLVVDALISDVRPYMPTPADIDYAEGSKLTKSRIYEGFGTSPLVTGQVENGNRAQAYVAHDTLNFLQVNPLATLMSETMTKRLGPLFSEGESQDGRLVIWIDHAMAKDPDLMQGRFDSVSKLPGVLTKGEARQFLATGEYERTPKDDDDEPTGQAAAPTKPDGPGPGGFASGPNASLNPYSLRQWGNWSADAIGQSGGSLVSGMILETAKAAPGDGISLDTVTTQEHRAQQTLVLSADHPLAEAIKSGKVLVGASFTAILEEGTWRRAISDPVPGNSDQVPPGASAEPTLESGSGQVGVLLERSLSEQLPSEMAVLPGGSVLVRLAEVWQ